MGQRHPLPHLRNTAIHSFHRAGIQVDILDPHEVGVSWSNSRGEGSSSAAVAWDDDALANETYMACLKANEALMHSAVCKRPLSILKYAMTLDGKIACASGHSAWISGPDSR